MTDYLFLTFVFLCAGVIAVPLARAPGWAGSALRPEVRSCIAGLSSQT